MSRQTIQFGYDKDAVWRRVSGRLCVFLDTNCWINMADGKKEASVRTREKLRELVATGRVFCPVSWGTLEELFCQSGPSLLRTASLMEELSMNAVFIMRTELYAWELTRALRRFRNCAVTDSLNGLFAPPAAFIGSGPSVSLNLPDGVSLSAEAQTHAQAFMKENLSAIGITKLAEDFGGSTRDRTPPAYSEAAKKAREAFKGDKKKLFVEEAGNSFRMYITPLLPRYSSALVISWLAQFRDSGDEWTWFQKALAELPALHNFTEVMVVANEHATGQKRQVQSFHGQ